MPKREVGKAVPMSLPRKWVCDLLHFSKRVPIITAERPLRIRACIEARRKTPQPPSWSAILLKAFGLASQRVPEMRRSYLGAPWGRLHEMPYSVGSLVIDREYQGEHAVFCCPLLYPERMSLDEIHTKTDRWKKEPVEDHGPLRRIVKLTKLPLPIRRFAWWFGMNVSGYWKARYYGTFAINSLAGMRGSIMQMCFPCTCFLYYGIPDKDGTMPVQFGFDHRVFDGFAASRALGELEGILNHEIVEELQALPRAVKLAA